MTIGGKESRKIIQTFQKKKLNGGKLKKENDENRKSEENSRLELLV
jgi:hypothetical protein